MLEQLGAEIPSYQHVAIDIRDWERILNLTKQLRLNAGGEETAR